MERMEKIAGSCDRFHHRAFCHIGIVCIGFGAVAVKFGGDIDSDHDPFDRISQHLEKTTNRTFSTSVSANYFIALFFGLIHGLGFANYFRSLFGEMGSITQPLLAFNIGLELGQLMIVVLFFGFYALLSQMFRIQQRDWNLFISGAGAGVAVTLIINLWMN